MTPVNECREQLDKIKARLQEYQKQLKTSTTAENRSILKEKIRVYRSAIKDIQLQIAHMDPSSRRERKSNAKTRLNVGGLSFDFFERNNVCWSDLEGKRWSQVEELEDEAMNHGVELIQKWVEEGSAYLTDRQRIYMDEYYNNGYSLEKISEKYNVHTSTVSRVIGNGLNRIKNWVNSKKLGEDCRYEPGNFDWVRYLTSRTVLTDRQRELLLIMLSENPPSSKDIAKKLEVDPSTISRTLSKAASTIQQLNIKGKPTRYMDIGDWNESDKCSLAIRTGMPLSFYYRYCFSRQRISGLTRYRYEIAKRKAAGKTAREIAEEFGIRPQAVQSAFDELKRRKFELSQVPDYFDDSIGSKIDPETYVKLQKLVIENAGS